MNTITIEDLERLASELEANETAQRERLLRLICAEARILAAREPHLFERMPTEYGDEAGHWDNSFPPKKEYRCRTGPRLLEVRDNTTDDVATSSGFYYSWKRVTTDLGLYVARDGSIYGADETGTGRLGQFAARPGDCDVECTIEWSQRDRNDLTLDELREVESHLRALAFPLSQAAAS
jgi:hypothetical protein